MIKRTCGWRINLALYLPFYNISKIKRKKSLRMKVQFQCTALLQRSEEAITCYHFEMFYFSLSRTVVLYYKTYSEGSTYFHFATSHLLHNWRKGEVAAEFNFHLYSLSSIWRLWGKELNWIKRNMSDLFWFRVNTEISSSYILNVEKPKESKLYIAQALLLIMFIQLISVALYILT